MHVVTSKEKGSRSSSRRRLSPLGSVSEAALLRRAQGKDVGAFEELVGRSEARLYRLAMRYVCNESDAQEILQNTFLSAWRNLPTFAGRSQFGSWIHRITVNASLMLFRTRNRHPEIAIGDVEPLELNDAIGQVTQKLRMGEDWSRRPDEEFQCAELRRRIEIAVDSLPGNLRSIFLMRDVWEMSTEDSAAKLRVSIPAAKTRLHRARKVLRESLGHYVAS
jgi:RNA polymerase sigma-70 factor (ECF subfamily)